MAEEEGSVEVCLLAGEKEETEAVNTEDTKVRVRET